MSFVWERFMMLRKVLYIVHRKGLLVCIIMYMIDETIKNIFLPFFDMSKHLLPVQWYGNVIWQLSPHGEDQSLRLLQFVDLHHRFKRNLIKIETVTLIVV